MATAAPRDLRDHVLALSRVPHLGRLSASGSVRNNSKQADSNNDQHRKAPDAILHRSPQASGRAVTFKFFLPKREILKER
jgi:hypothetical protein